MSTDLPNCPVCGYFCNGKGGQGCIDRPWHLKQVQKETEPEVDANVHIHPTAESKEYAVARDVLKFVKEQPTCGIVCFVLVPTTTGKPAVMPFLSDVGLHEMSLLNALLNTMTNNQVKNSFASYDTVDKVPPDDTA